MLEKPNILIVEDEAAIADTIRYALSTDGFAPVWCATGSEALAILKDQAIALAVLDVGLPDMNGFELFRRMQQVCDVPVIFLTARNEEIDRVVGLELGADDYIAKPFSPRELSARVRVVLRRLQKSAALPASASGQQAVLQQDSERRRISYYGQPLELSRYEYGLLQTLMAHPGRVYSRDELLDMVWDDSNERFDRTVDTHIKTLRAKLAAITPALDPIVTHRGIGYALADNLPRSQP